MALPGAVEVNETVCEAGPTANDWCACGAACQLALPGWSASMVQVPAAVKLTVVPLIVQTPALAAAMPRLTARPELAVAPTGYVLPTTARRSARWR